MDDSRSAIRQWLDFGTQTLGSGHKGYFSAGGWAFEELKRLSEHLDKVAGPIPMLLFCPKCGLQHIDAPNEARGWTNPPHKSHECQGCREIWRPADVATTGVQKILTRGKADTWRAPLG